RDRVVGELLISLVAFAGDENDVARFGERDGAGYGLRAVGNGFEIGRAKTLFYLRDDRERIFFPRIIRGHDAVVGGLVRDSPHQRSLLFVAIAAGAKDDKQAARTQLAQSLENIEERVGSMSVIDEDLELTFCRHRFQSTWNLGHLAQAQDRLAQAHA